MMSSIVTFWNAGLTELGKNWAGYRWEQNNDQLLREANRVKCLEFAIKCIEERECFIDLIFADKCSIQVANQAKLSFWSDQSTRYRVHVWVQISKRGTHYCPDVYWQDGC